MPDLDAMRDLLLQIVRSEILTIRAHGWGGRASECSILADHIHNLPNLIRKPSIDGLEYYLGVERPDYAKQVRNTKIYEKEWSQLEKILEQWKAEVSLGPD